MRSLRWMDDEAERVFALLHVYRPIGEVSVARGQGRQAEAQTSTERRSAKGKTLGPQPIEGACGRTPADGTPRGWSACPKTLVSRGEYEGG